ncbi:hypothetical protein FLK61_38190 [Paenalkalicoccus suaedae]|uniref:Transcriptional regulator n=2 Tax=Paenalkalicoccus suaedae TaxID=2592382 RepID=A0A859FKJ6_9BACI|nr:hypothetical protein FLK61_38190 [Paenalkalicoccus suaedae]
MAHYQMKNYQLTMRELSTRDSGYLGVGVQKRRFGKGIVTIVVSDVDGTIVEARKMEGVTVFSRFKAYQDIVGKNIHEVKGSINDAQTLSSVEMAVQKINEQKI